MIPNDVFNLTVDIISTAEAEIFSIANSTHVFIYFMVTFCRTQSFNFNFRSAVI